MRKRIIYLVCLATFLLAACNPTKVVVIVVTATSQANIETANLSLSQLPRLPALISLHRPGYPLKHPRLPVLINLLLLPLTPLPLPHRPLPPLFIRYSGMRQKIISVKMNSFAVLSWVVNMHLQAQGSRPF